MTDRRKNWSSRFSARFGAIRYRYVLAPFVWDTSDAEPFWRLPDTTQGGIDLRPLPAQSLAGGAPQGVAFVAATQPVGGSEIARANYVDEATTTAMRDAWQSITGYRPDGAQLRDLLWDQLTTGADPTGEAGPKPLMPAGRQLELWLGGHSRIKREAFIWGIHPHTNRVQAVLQRDFERLWEATNGDDLCRKVLDFQCEKFGVADWRELVPQRLRKHVPGRLPHATTITDSFNGANSDTFGVDLTWTELSGDWDISSNQGGAPSGVNLARADSDLSGTDHYAQIVIEATGGQVGPLCRKDSTATVTFYHGRLNSPNVQLFKFVAGVATQIGSNAAVSVGLPDTIRVQASGSTISVDYEAVNEISETDTAISAGTRCGVRAFGSATIDDFEASDLAAGGLSIPIAAYHYNHHLNSMC